MFWKHIKLSLDVIDMYLKSLIIYLADILHSCRKIKVVYNSNLNFS